MNGIEKPRQNIDQMHIPEKVKTQLGNLGIQMEDIQGKVLDVGAGDGSFAQELSKFTQAEFVSVDTNIENERGVIEADARQLPFDDNSFDLVISHASIPGIFVGAYDFDNPDDSQEHIKESVTQSFRENLRVLRTGGEVILAPINMVDNYESQQVLTEAIEQAIDTVRHEGAEISLEVIEEGINPHTQEPYKYCRLRMVKSDSDSQ